MDAWYFDHLICPRDGAAVSGDHNTLICTQGHHYPVVDGIPIMLLEDVEQTLWVAETSINRAWESDPSGLYLDTVGISDEERRGVLSLVSRDCDAIDPVVSYLVAATNGVMYRPVIGRLTRYPIPYCPLPQGNGRSLLDIGCNWGRWSISAARRGWNVVGIDPSLGAVLAASRVAQSMNLPVRYVVGDGRYLPFGSDQFDGTFSYGVLQHLSHENVTKIAEELARVLKPQGFCMVQMPNRLGLRSIYQQARRRFRAPFEFEVRYWPISELRRVFSKSIGDTRISIDCFGGLGIQKADWDLMSTARKLVIAGSETAKFVSRLFPILLYVADSVYVRSTKSAHAS
jgi:SAM-dependent methyltransferase/uncharacterized protein YbaR (Trm112 family)